MKATLASLPQFVRFLNVFPSPTAVVEAALGGPLAALGARAGMLWQVRGEHLVALGASGHTTEEVHRYSALPLALDTGVCAAVRSKQVQVDDLAAPWPDHVADLADDKIDAMVTRLDASLAVTLPVIYGGVAIGALGFLTARRPHDSGHDQLVLDGVTSVIALWMSHPKARIDGVAAVGDRSWSMAMSPRQRRILELVAAGQSTAAMAAALDVSEATVKADLQRSMKALRTSNRQEAARRARALRLID